MVVGDAVDGAVALDVGALFVALIFSNAASDHGTCLEARQTLVGALDGVDVAALVFGGAHGLAFAEILDGGSLGVSLSLGGGGVLGGDLRGDVVGTLGEFLGEVLVESIVEIIVEVIEVLVVVLLPVLALERDTGVGVVGVGVGVRRGGGDGIVFANIRVGLDGADGIVADVVFELLRELLRDCLLYTSDAADE